MAESKNLKITHSFYSTAHIGKRILPMGSGFFDLCHVRGKTHSFYSTAQ